MRNPTTTSSAEEAEGRIGTRSLIALLSVQVMFGTLPLTGQLAMEGMEPLALATLRIVGAALVLALVTGRRLGAIRAPADWARLALYTALGVVGNQLLFLSGLHRTTQINASILMATIPVFTLGFALLMRREKARPMSLAGIGLGLAGALILTGVERFDLSSRTVVGNLMIVSNTTCWSLHLVLARSLLKRHDPLVVSTWMFIMGAVVMLPLGLGSIVDAVGRASAGAWAAAAWAVAVPTILSYLVNMWALRRVEASRVAAYVYLQPVVAGVLAWLFAGEVLTVRTGIAAALIFAGVALVRGRGGKLRGPPSPGRTRPPGSDPTDR